MIINPGSENKGGTFKQALINAKEWLVNINKEFPEVEMTTNEDKFYNGDWNFKFIHKITGKIVELQIHGFTKEECKLFTFNPRVYWNGSSTSEPDINDWLTDDYTYRVVYKKKSKTK